MTAVTVDLKDLETIIHATAVIKTIEGGLAQRRQDPFVREHLDYTEAHDRLAAAMRNATRAAAGTLIGWDDPLTKREAATLIALRAMSHKNNIEGTVTVTPKDRLDRGEIDSLAAKGCMQVGQPVHGIVWPGADVVSDVIADPTRYSVKITDRGRVRLTEWEATQAQKALPAPKAKK